MHKCYFLLSLFALSFIFPEKSVAADPFDNKQRNGTTQLEQPKTTDSSLSIPNCENQPPLVLADIDFQQLRLVGVVISSANEQVLFVHNQQELISVKKGDVFSQQHFQLDQVEKNQITLRKWQADCSLGPIQKVRF